MIYSQGDGYYGFFQDTSSASNHAREKPDHSAAEDRVRLLTQIETVLVADPSAR